MSRKVKLKTNLGNIREHTKQVFEEIAARWAIWYAWGIGASGEHAEGRALDLMTLNADQSAYRDQVGHEIAAYLWENRHRLVVWYIIWNRRIISMTRPDEGWIPYNGDNPHTDHVHVSFYRNAEYSPPTDGEDDEMSWSERIENLNWSGQGQYEVNGTKSAGRMLAEVEAMTDRNAAQLGDLDREVNRAHRAIASIAKALEAMAAGMGETVQDAVRTALADAVIDVNVNVSQGDTK